MPGPLSAPASRYECSHCKDVVYEYRDQCRQCGQERPGTPVREPGVGHWRCPRCKVRNGGTTDRLSLIHISEPTRLALI
eukprot:775965-Alexandrium_andersonii.AAC.1